MKNKRPVNLNLLTVRFPIVAIASILHRISGLFLFFCIPFLLWMLTASLASVDRFEQLRAFLTSLPVKIFIWLMLSALIYHLLAGIKHLLLDVHIGETLSVAKITSRCVLGLAILCSILLGVWLW